MAVVDWSTGCAVSRLFSPALADAHRRRPVDDGRWSPLALSYLTAVEWIAPAFAAIAVEGSYR